MNKKSMLEALISHFTNGNKAQFSKLLGVSPQTISAWIARNTFDSELIYAKCRYINPSWLLTGQGDMLVKNDVQQNVETKREAIPAMEGIPSDIAPIPLVTEHAAAGFGNDCFSIQESDVKDYYIIPKFRFNHVDFMIEVSGISMYPHFKSGDVIACTILHEAKYIQWNRCHVIATRDQGILVKRIMPSEKEGCFKIVSENKDFPPFDLPKEDITGLALVVGCVSLE
ncbi:LexA family transcriptional regulator [Prevotella sp.]|jgi:phage repressor protein C with HTH and peptisase S24 domain|uniref:LexA family transcriptional regulator n=1 Tax=Prevotella sp. TaxID=59823 RepID=UPI0025D7F4DD|nr:S24 family peptidase [Prevotella sp.]